MTVSQGYFHNLSRLAALAWPLAMAQLAQFAITLTDSLMLGWYSVEALAASVLGGTLFFLIFIFGSGFPIAVVPLVASATAAGEYTEVRRITRMAGWLSLVFALCFLPVFWSSEGIFLWLGQNKDVARLASEYLQVAGLALVPGLLAHVFKSYLAGLEVTKMPMLFAFLAVGVNAVLNFLLIFGNFGLPELGVLGAAWASFLVNVFLVICLAIYAQWRNPEQELFVRLWRPDFDILTKVARLGLPIGLMYLAEAGMFSASSIMMGWFGTVSLAAHGIVLQIISTIFMLHLGFTSATTIRIGQAFGVGDREKLVLNLWSGATLVLGVVVLSIIAFVIIPEQLILAFMDPEEPAKEAVLKIALPLLWVAAIFQLFDAGQVLGASLLRGVQDTRLPMIIALVGYWVVGVPMGYYLGVTREWQGLGVWSGLAFGLAFAAVFLFLRFWRFYQSWDYESVAQKAAMRSQAAESSSVDVA